MKQSKRYLPSESRRLAAAVFLLCWIAYWSTYIGRLNYSAAMAQMTADSVLTKAQGGQIATVFFACYGVGQLLSGFVADRVSPFWMVGAGVALSAGANWGMSLPVGTMGLSLFWGCNGIAQSMVWAPIVRIFSQILPENMRLRASVHINSTVPLGSLAAYLLSALLLRSGNWQGLFRWSAVCLLAVAAVWGVFFFCKRGSFPREEAAAGPAEKAAEGPRLLPLLALSGVGGALLPAALHGMLKDGVTTWFPTFLSEIHATSPDAAVLITGILPFVNLTGAYLASWLNRKWLRNEMKTASAMFLLCGIALLGLFLFGQSSRIVFVCAAAVATTSMFGVNTMVISVLPMYFGSQGKASAISGILNSSAYLGSAVSMAVFGGIAEASGWYAVMLLWLGLAVVGTLAFWVSARKWRRYTEKVCP